MSAAGDSWGQWVVNGAVWTTIGGAVTWLTNLLRQRRVHKAEIAEKKQAREDRLTEHTSGLAVELLKIANGEVKMLKEQIAHLSGQMSHVSELERRLGYFEEALFHIGQLIDGTGGVGRAAAEDNARVFLGKMVILREITGISANREQAARAAGNIGDKGIEDGRS